MSNWWESSPVAEEKTDATPAANWWDEHPTEGDQGAPKKQNTSLIGDIGTGLKRGALQIPGIATGLGDIVSAPLAVASGVRKPISKAADWLGKKTGLQFGKWADEATAEYSPEMQQAIAHVDEAQGFFPALKAAVEKPRSIANLVAESLPSTLVGGVAARGAMGAVMGAERLAATRLAAAAGDKAAKASLLKAGSIAGGIGEGAVTAGQQMEQTDESVDPLRAAGSAIGSGIGTGIIGTAGGRLATKLGLPDVDTAFAAGTLGDGVQAGTTLAAKTANVGKRMAIGGVQEGVFEEMPQSAQEQVWQNVANGKPWDEGIGEAMAQGLIAGTAMGAGVNALPRGTAVEPEPNPQAEPINGMIPQNPESAGLPDEQLLQTEAPASTETFEKTKLPPAGPLSAAVNAGIDSGATSLDPVAPTSPVLRERDFVPPPSGNFGQMNEFADLIDSKRQEIEANRLKFEQTRKKIAAQREGQSNGEIPASPINAEVATPSLEVGRGELPGSGTVLASAPVSDTGRTSNSPEVAQSGVRPVVAAGSAGAPSLNINPQGIDNGAQANQTIESQTQRTEESAAAVAPEVKGYKLGQAKMISGRRTNQGLPSEIYPHPTQEGMYAIRPIGENNASRSEPARQQPTVETPAAAEQVAAVAPVQAATTAAQETPAEVKSAAPTQERSVEKTESGVVAVKGYPEEQIRAVAKTLGYRVIVGSNGNALFSTGSDAAKIKKELGFVKPKSAPASADKPAEPVGMFIGNRNIGKAHVADEEVTVKNGVVHIGKYPAVNFETGEDVTVPENADPATIRDALQRSGAIEPGLNFYGVPGETKQERDDAKEFNDLYQTESADLASLRENIQPADLPRADAVSAPVASTEQAQPKTLQERIASNRQKKAAENAERAKKFADLVAKRKAVKAPSDAPKNPEKLDTSAERVKETAENKPASQERGGQKLEDFGERLDGAKKHTWASSLTAVSDGDIAASKLSDAWPHADYQELIDNGADTMAVGLVRSLRDSIPSKPRLANKVRRWAATVAEARKVANELIEVKIKVDELRAMKDVYGRAELYAAVGHEKSLEGMTFAWRHYSLYKGQENVSFWSVEQQVAATAFSNFPREVAKGDTKEAALEAFREEYKKLGSEAQKKKSSYVIFVEHGKSGYFIGKKIGRNTVTLSDAFKTVAEARAYRDNHSDALDKALEKYKEVPRERRDTNNPRVGEDMRDGMDATPEMFAEAFGFRGVQFGNWVEQNKRQSDLNDAYDALMDMAAVLGIPAKAISLNGELGLAFGARGSGGTNAAAAHYEPDTVVINLTKKNGAGSIGHEWWHALDGYFARMRNNGSHMTDALDVSLAARGSNFSPYPGVRKEMVEAFGAVMASIAKTGMADRSRNLDRKRTKDYWGEKAEMSARAFEAYLISKLQDQNASNDYLSNIVDSKTWEAAAALGLENENSYPYPTEPEIPSIRAGFDRFFQTIETKETENGIALFNQANDGRITPADKAIYGMAAEGKGAADILKFIADTSRNPFYRQLARLLQKTGIAPKIVVGTSDGWKFNAGEGKYAAAYNPKTDTVALFRPASSERNVLHEFVHAATLKALSKRGMAAVQMKKLFEHVAKSGKLKGMYGMANVDEFVAEAFSNPKFQEALKKVSAPTASSSLSNAWHWFVRVVRGILGIQQGQENALSAAMEIGVGVMRENMALQSGEAGIKYSYGLPARTPIHMPIDGPRLTALRRSAAGLERTQDGIFLRVTEGGEAIATGQKGQRIPDAFRRFAETNGLTFKAERRLPLLPAGTPAANAHGGVTPKTEPMPIAYRENGAMYFGGATGIGLDRTNRTRFNAGGQPASEKIKQTETEAFKKWFGDSKVVDKEGEPLVVYHGTSESFDSFDGTKDSSKKDHGFLGRGFYFSTSHETSGSYANMKGGAADPNIMPVFLSLQNPLRLLMDIKKTKVGLIRSELGIPYNMSYENVTPAAAQEITDKLRDLGYDGVVLDYPDYKKDTWKPNGKVKESEIVAFDSTQIKSAIGNNGDFNPNNPDIRYNIIGDSGRQYDAKHRAFFKNVGRDVDRQNVIEKTLDYLNSDFWKKMAVGIVDQFRGLRDLNDGGQAYLLARLSKGTAGAFDTLLHHGKLSLKDGVYDGDTSGGFVERLGVPLNGELDDFLWWVAANRAEKLTADGKENLFSPTDIQAGKSLAAGLTTFDYTIQTGQSKGTTTRNRQVIYQDALRVFNEFQKNVLDLSEESGLIDGASRQHWESEFYVPFYRVSEEGGEFVGAKMGNALVRQQAFKKLKGGTDKLNSDLLTNTLMNMSHLIEASAKNRAATAALKAAEKIGAARKAIHGEKNTVWFQENGQKVEYKVEDPFVMTAITSLEYAGMRNGVMDAMTKFKHLLTIGVTASPAFKVRNLIRDSIQAIGTSDLGYNPIKNVVDGFKQTNRESQAYVSALASGGLIRFGTMLEGSESSRVRQLIKAGVKDSSILNNEAKWRQFYDKYVDPAVSAYNELGNRSEEINRAALYNQLIKQGKSHGEAALLARDLMDFSMQGSFNTIRFLAQTVPFFNARLVGMYKLGRSAKDNPKKLAVVTGAVAVASIALMLGYDDDEDWKRREDWDRDGFWWFKFGGVEYRIPKPFEVGAVASLAERSVEYLINDEMTGERFRKVVGALAMNNLSMNPVPQMVKPMIDLYANKDSFTGRPIESMSMERLEKTMRFNSHTSMPARGLSNATLGLLSPVQYDHLARAYFGWLGAFAVGGADMAYRAVSDEPTQPALDYFKFFSQGILKEEGTGSSRYLSNLYDQASELETVYSTYRQLLKDGKYEDASEYAADNTDELRRYKSVEAIKKVQTKMNQNIRAIERDPDMDSGEKKIRIDRIQKMKEQFAKRISPGA